MNRVARPTSYTAYGRDTAKNRGSSPKEWCIGMPSRLCLEGWFSGLECQGLVGAGAPFVDVVRPGCGSLVVVPKAGLVTNLEQGKLDGVGRLVASVGG